MAANEFLIGNDCLNDLRIAGARKMLSCALKMKLFYAKPQHLPLLWSQMAHTQ